MISMWILRSLCVYYDLYACTTVTMRVLRSLCVYYGHYVNTKVTMWILRYTWSLCVFQVRSIPLGTTDKLHRWVDKLKLFCANQTTCPIQWIGEFIWWSEDDYDASCFLPTTLTLTWTGRLVDNVLPFSASKYFADTFARSWNHKLLFAKDSAKLFVILYRSLFFSLPHTLSDQCDQMSKLFFNIRPFSSMTIMLNGIQCLPK